MANGTKFEKNKAIHKSTFDENKSGFIRLKRSTLSRDTDVVQHIRILV